MFYATTLIHVKTACSNREEGTTLLNSKRNEDLSLPTPCLSVSDPWQTPSPIYVGKWRETTESHTASYRAPRSMKIIDRSKCISICEFETRLWILRAHIKVSTWFTLQSPSFHSEAVSKFPPFLIQSSVVEGRKSEWGRRGRKDETSKQQSHLHI